MNRRTARRVFLVSTLKGRIKLAAIRENGIREKSSILRNFSTAQLTEIFLEVLGQFISSTFYRERKCPNAFTTVQ